MKKGSVEMIKEDKYISRKKKTEKAEKIAEICPERQRDG